MNTQAQTKQQGGTDLQAEKNKLRQMFFKIRFFHYTNVRNSKGFFLLANDHGAESMMCDDWEGKKWHNVLAVSRNRYHDGASAVTLLQ